MANSLITLACAVLTDFERVRISSCEHAASMSQILAHLSQQRERLVEWTQHIGQCHGASQSHLGSTSPAPQAATAQGEVLKRIQALLCNHASLSWDEQQLPESLHPLLAPNRTLSLPPATDRTLLVLREPQSSVFQGTIMSISQYVDILHLTHKAMCPASSDNLSSASIFQLHDGANGDLRLALQDGAEYGCHGLLDFLLEIDSDRALIALCLNDALYASCPADDEALVHAMIMHGAGPEVAAAHEYGTALQAASVIGSSQIVDILIQAGWDVNAVGGYFGTALQAAAFAGHLPIMETLWKCEADVHIVAGAYGTALGAAYAEQQFSAAHFLKERGATCVSREPLESLIGLPGYPSPFPFAISQSFSAAEDELLMRLRDAGVEPRHTWEQITQFFPGRQAQTLQVRYWARLKPAREVVESLTRDSGFHSSLERPTYSFQSS